jgi:hypothetical protein
VSKLATQWMFLEKSTDCPAQLSRAVAVHNAQLAEVGGHCLIEEFLEPCQRFVNGVADDVELGQGAGSRLKIDIDPDSVGRVPRSGARGGPGKPEIPQCSPGGASPAHINLGMFPVQLDDDAFESERANRHARSHSISPSSRSRPAAVPRPRPP